MPDEMHTDPEARTSPSATTRRSFLQGATAGLVGAVTLGEALSSPRPASAAGERDLTVALVGCGGRGTGAARQALATGPRLGRGRVRLVAMADAFPDRLEQSFEALSEAAGDAFPEDALDLPPENRYVGFDAYRKAIDSGADVVILATPPGFRPEHFAYAIERGKHVFMEKPVAVDAPGVRQVLDAADEAKRRNLKVGVGLQRHHQPLYLETVKRIHDGAIGDVVLMRVYWNSAGVWVNERQKGMTEMEYQMRNWYYFNWLCGDHIVEQHIHNIDVANWVKGAHPVSAQGQGGRQARTGLDHGEIFDHHFVELTYADGSTALSQCRHIEGCWDQVAEFAHGTRGRAEVAAGRIFGSGGWSWAFGPEEQDPYQLEHDHLFAAIREDLPFAEAENGAIATMSAILGRMATYSGQLITWDEALASEISLAPQHYDWKADPPVLPDAAGRYAIAVPGKTVAV